MIAYFFLYELAGGGVEVHINTEFESLIEADNSILDGDQGSLCSFATWMGDGLLRFQMALIWHANFTLK